MSSCVGGSQQSSGEISLIHIKWIVHDPAAVLTYINVNTFIIQINSYVITKFVPRPSSKEFLSQTCFTIIKCIFLMYMFMYIIFFQLYSELRLSFKLTPHKNNVHLYRTRNRTRNSWGVVTGASVCRAVALSYWWVTACPADTFSHITQWPAINTTHCTGDE